MMRTTRRARWSDGLVAMCLGGLALAAALLIAHLVRHGIGSCDAREPVPAHEFLVNAAIAVGVADLVLCAASWYPLREADRAEWPVLIGAGAALLVLASLAAKYGVLHGDC